MNSTKQELFKKSSTTYYTSSLFFPKEIKTEIYILYAFVRTADNFVDSIPADKTGFLSFKKQTIDHLNGIAIKNDVIKEFVLLAKRKQFQTAWTISFLASMEQDLTKKTYKTFSELEEYMYGSAEVIGLYIASILSLPKTAFPLARELGKAMQLINIIRDIKEDLTLGRTYIPQEDLKKFNISSLTKDTPHMKDLILYEILRWKKIQQKAENGMQIIPRHSRICIKTASDMYIWTAKQIEKKPLLVFDKKVKPSKSRILTTYLINTITL